MPRTMENRLLRMNSPLGEDVLLIRGMTGSEALGRLFYYELDLISEKTDIAFADIVAKPVAIGLKTTSGAERFFHGYVNRFSQTSVQGALATYRATVVPWTWFMTQRSDCRIFQDMTVPDIIKQVFRDLGMTDFDDSGIDGSQYEAWEYCVQYRETDFNFVCRLMEQEGIYFYFKHAEDKHTLMLCDSPDAHAASPDHATINYRPQAAGREEPDRILDWVVAQEFRSESFAQTDFDFVNPSKDLTALAQVDRQKVHPELSLFDFPGEYLKNNVGDRLARVRLDELQSGHELATCRTDARGLCVGQKFKMAEHPREDQNKEYLAVAGSFFIKSDTFLGGGSSEESESQQQYSCKFTLMDATKQFRPERRTPKPIVQGCQTAIVTGKDGEEIWTDKYGRIKVRFHWDRHGAADETSSCWVRVAQMWAGKKWGAMFLPRVGQEVVVDFLEGDPDRPLVTGRVYNGTQMPPYELPANSTMSTIKTLSSKGGGGFNELRFEDKKGEEQIFIHAEKNLDARIKNDRFDWVGNNGHVIVVNDTKTEVQNNAHTKVGVDRYEEVGTDYHLKVGGKEAHEVTGSLSLKVGGAVAEKFDGACSREVAGALYIKGMNVVIEGTSKLTLKSGGSEVVIDSAGVTAKGAAVTLDSSAVKIASGPGSGGGSGSAESIVAPTAPEAPEEADTADPGEMAAVKAEQLQTQSGKYGAAKVKPFKPSEDETTEKSWIEIELLDEQDKPIPGEPYEVKLPDGSVAHGTLDNKGFARIEGFEPGQCQVTFPRLDQDVWSKK